MLIRIFIDKYWVCVDVGSRWVRWEKQVVCITQSIKHKAGNKLSSYYIYVIPACGLKLLTTSHRDEKGVWIYLEIEVWGFVWNTYPSTMHFLIIKYKYFSSQIENEFYDFGVLFVCMINKREMWMWGEDSNTTACLPN